MNDPKRPWLLNVKSSEADAMDDDADVDRLPRDTMGLAISGGGIRSAAFSLGVIQALARSNWLRHVDFLSTVSGGGYTGSFLGRFFDQCMKTDGVAGSFGDVEDGAAQDRVRRELTDARSPVIHWLRCHANYLSPTGLGESLFNFATFWRNFLSMYFVLAFFFFALFGLVNAIAYWSTLQNFVAPIISLLSGLAPLTSLLPDSVASIWLGAAEQVLWLAVVPLMFSYWLASQDRYRSFVIAFLIVCVLLSIAVLFVTKQPFVLAVFAAAIGWTMESWSAVNQGEGRGNPSSQWRMALARNHLTYRLVFWVTVAAALFGFAIVDGLGRAIARDFLLQQGMWTGILTGFTSFVGVVLAISPILRMIATGFIAGEGTEGGWLKAILRIPYIPTLLVLLIGALIPLVVVSFTGHVAYELGYSYAMGLGATVLAVVVTLLLGTRESLPFVNRSGPLTIYAARLARVFLGAVNPQRFRRDDGKNVSHVIEGDDVPFHQYAPHSAGGPLHLVNVAVNETMDVASRRAMRDRKAENMAVGPAGLNLATEWHGVWTKANDADTPSVMPVTDGVTPNPFLTASPDGASRESVEVESLSLRQWMGISGAAVSPGSGQYSTLATSLLLTLGNARLGYWWDSGLKAKERAWIGSQLTLLDHVASFLQRILGTQHLLLSELKGRFAGPWKKYWYLSDGGHFECSGLYELLRRRVPYIIFCGASKDRQNEATDIAEIARIARIDFGCEVEEIGLDESPDWSALGVPEAAAARLGALPDLLTQDNSIPKKHATLLRATFPNTDEDAWNGRSESWILYVKATLTGDEPADVRNYAATHPDFPNQSTLDQFFDERQWESYRKLGDHIGSQVFL